MRVDTILEVVKGSLYSVKYKGDGADQLSVLFRNWYDPDYLNTFFEEHREDLESSFWRGISVEQAIIKTHKDAKKLQSRLLKVARSGLKGGAPTLSDIFEPLVAGRYSDEFEKDKLKGELYPSWLRLYAVRVDINLFVISGGGIKLTRTMNNRAHLLTELKKLDLTIEYLKEGDEEVLESIELR